MIDHGANIYSQLNHPETNNETVLALAIELNVIEVIKLVHRQDKSDYSLDNLGNKALHLAALYSDLDAIQYFLSCKNDINSKNIYGNTPLMLAIKSGHLEATEYLLQNGANIDTLDNDGKTGFYYSRKNKRMHRILIGYGYDCYVNNECIINQPGINNKEYKN